MFISRNSISISLLGFWVCCSYVAAQHSLYDSQNHQLYDSQKQYPYQYASKSQDYISNPSGHNSVLAQKPLSYANIPTSKVSYPYVSSQDWHHQQHQLQQPQQQHHIHGPSPIIHKSGLPNNASSPKYKLPVINQAIYQAWLQNKQLKHKPALVSYNGYPSLPSHTHKHITTKKPKKGKNSSHKKSIIFGITMPSLFYKLFPQFMPFIGVETYKLTVHRYPMVLVTAKK